MQNQAPWSWRTMLEAAKFALRACKTRIKLKGFSLWYVVSPGQYIAGMTCGQHIAGMTCGQYIAGMTGLWDRKR